MSFRDLSFSSYQLLAKSTAVYPYQGNNVTYPLLGLVGEAGEIANKYKKVLRGDKKLYKAEIAAELGDVLWYCAALASELGFNLGEIAQQNIDKLFTRKENGTLQGDGDNR